MSPDLIAEFAHLDSRLDAMVERVRGFSPEIRKAPVGKSFSPIQALEHMAVLERNYAGMLARVKKEGLSGKRGKPNFIYAFVIKNMNKPAKVATPTAPMFQPKGAQSIDESAKVWRECRAKVVEHLKQFGDDEAAVKHPFMGLLSPRDLFILLEKHQDYHDVRLP